MAKESASRPGIAVEIQGRRLSTEAEAVWWTNVERGSFAKAVDDLLSEERFSAATVFARIKEVLDLRTDAELAWVLGISPQSLWNRKNKNSVPFREALFIAHRANVSLEYLLTGETPGRRGGGSRRRK
jgi:hypothetical protein